LSTEPQIPSHAILPEGPRATLEVSTTGALTLDDLDRMELEGPHHSRPTVKKIRYVHHTIARMMAIGTPDQEISAVTGSALSGLATLRKSPAFQELLSHYTESAQDLFSDFQHKIANTAARYLDMLNDLADEGSLEPNFVLSSFEKLSDRAGFGPITRSTNVHQHTHLDAGDIRVIKSEVLAEQRGSIVKASFERTRPEEVGPEVEELGSGDSGSPVGEALGGQAAAQGTEVQRDES
jgi:hypothetical protein